MGASLVTQDDVLNSPALPVVLDLEAAGVRFRVAGDQVLVSPTGVLTPAHREVLRQHREAVFLIVATSTDVGVQARRDTFRQQLDAAAPGTIPAFLFQVGVPYVEGACFSCAACLPALHFGRCWRCSLAWRLACRVPISAECAAATDAARVA
jgi:hypothetical protein